MYLQKEHGLLLLVGYNLYIKGHANIFKNSTYIICEFRSTLSQSSPFHIHQVCNNSNTTGATCGAGIFEHLGTPMAFSGIPISTLNFYRVTIKTHLYLRRFVLNGFIYFLLIFNDIQ